MSRTTSSLHTRESTEGKDFIRTRIDEDLAAGRHGGRVATRFPPEPNGFLHIGHAKSICLNFGIAEEYGGSCNLRFDDTNPLTEDMRYVEAIQEDVRWLGFEWDDLFFASDYFERLWDKAVELVEKGLAYVDSLSEEEIREYRGTVTEPGRESPYRSRTVEENLDLLRRMRAGEFEEGEHVLRARIDMAAPNMKMRDPLLYRIRHAEHYRTHDDWCIYPMYDFTHCLSDAFEGITHSLCTLEFENNREIYDWVLDNVETEYRPEQIEFARLNLSYTVLSKRKLLRLVEEGHVDGWDDPRMPTISGFRARGYTPEAIRDFCDRIGVAKANSVIDVGLLEHSIRDDLNTRAPRAMGVLRPLEVVIENYPEGEIEELDAPSWPRDVPKEGSRPVPFGRRIYIDRDDFLEDPPPSFHRLAPGREVRLRWGYVVRCTDVVKDPESREVVELRCTYDPETRGGSTPDGRKIWGTIHWVSAERSVPAEIRLYDRLFSDPFPDKGKEGPDFTTFLNPRSLEILQTARVEPSLADAEPGTRYQFERLGYFFVARNGEDGPAFHRIVTLKDTWAKLAEAAEDPHPEPEKERPEPKRRTPEPEPRDPLADLDPGARALARTYRDEGGIPEEEAAVLAGNPALARFHDASAVEAPSRAVANWIVNELLGQLGDRTVEEADIGPSSFAELVLLVEDGTISARIGKDVLGEMLASGRTAREIVDERDLEQIGDRDAIRDVVDEVLASHPEKVAAYREGRRQLFGFFVGQVMKATRGRANPKLANEILDEVLGTPSE